MRLLRATLPERLRVRVGQGIAIIGAGLLASGCVSATSSLNATPTMTPTPVPVLGKLTLAHFPSTVSGVAALELCEGWAQLRGQYVTAVRQDTPYQRDIWFSGPAWSPLFGEAARLEGRLAYPRLTFAFGQATVPVFASIPDARDLDAACG
jgi:hypothetical protein